MLKKFSNRKHYLLEKRQNEECNLRSLNLILFQINKNSRTYLNVDWCESRSCALPCAVDNGRRALEARTVHINHLYIVQGF